MKSHAIDRKALREKSISKRRLQFSRKLLKWREDNNYDQKFPWRNSQSRYKILLSEVLLKKTTRKQVASEWKNILMSYKNFEDLRKSNLRSLKKVLKPLGLEHTRSKNLKEISKKILNDFGGKVPSTKDDLLSLPGVGPYTANAVLCFAFQHDVSMVDTNIMRVVKRIFSIVTNKTRERTDKKIWRFVEDLPPKGRGKAFNYAILDFASEVCTAKNPKCPTCPMRKICGYYKNNF